MRSLAAVGVGSAALLGSVGSLGSELDRVTVREGRDRRSSAAMAVRVRQSAIRTIAELFAVTDLDAVDVRVLARWWGEE